MKDKQIYFTDVLASLPEYDRFSCPEICSDMELLDAIQYYEELISSMISKGRIKMKKVRELYDTKYRIEEYLSTLPISYPQVDTFYSTTEILHCVE